VPKPPLGVDTDLAKALSHPVRVQALRILNDRDASPSDIARELELPIANVSYHVQALVKLGCIEMVEARHVGGSVEHVYRGVRRPMLRLRDVEALPAVARDTWMAQVAQVAFDDLYEVLEEDLAGDRADIHTSWTRLRLDERGWTEVYEVLLTALEAALRIQDEAVARLNAPGSPAREMRAMLSIFYYESPPR
jgi:DNA-binding transcriptional ArsR family regulator